MSKNPITDFKKLKIPFDIPDMNFTKTECRIEIRVRDEDYEKACEWADNFNSDCYSICISEGYIE